MHEYIHFRRNNKILYRKHQLGIQNPKPLYRLDMQADTRIDTKGAGASPATATETSLCQGPGAPEQPQMVSRSPRQPLAPPIGAPGAQRPPYSRPPVA